MWQFKTTKLPSATARLEVNLLAQILTRHSFNVFDERGRAVCDMSIVLGVGLPHEFGDRFRWLALIEHEAIERHRALLVQIEG